jgi:hypothetical protein
MASILGSGSVHHQGRRRMVRITSQRMTAIIGGRLSPRVCTCSAAAGGNLTGFWLRSSCLLLFTPPAALAPASLFTLGHHSWQHRLEARCTTAGAEPGGRQRGRGVPAVPADGALDIRVQECAGVQGAAHPHPAAHAAQGRTGMDASHPSLWSYAVFHGASYAPTCIQ